jgi:DNA polymerase-3 subunit beta
MDITIDQTTLLKALARAAGATDPRGTMPILGHVLLDAKGTTVRIVATDLFKSLTMSVDCSVKTPGAIAVPAKDLLERVKAMPRAPITLSHKDGVVSLKAAGSARKFTIRCQPGDDFPPVAQAPKDNPGDVIPIAPLKKLIDGTDHAVSLDQTRAHLNSMLFDFDGDIARTVGTDGHRLALSTGGIKTRAAFKMLIPQSALKEIGKLCDEALASGGDAEVKLVVGDTLAFFEFPAFAFSCKTVEATFPPYSQVIPKEGKVATVDRLGLIDVVRAVAVAANDRTGGVKLAFSQNKLEVFAEGPESGDGRDEMVIDYSGPKLTTGMAASYVVDALNSISGEQVAVSLLGELDPIKVTPVGGDEFLGVVMPMRI